jgi:hypothetical protein
MREEWWEKPTCWLCDYWWLILLLMLIGLGAYFARNLWRPPAAVPTPTFTVRPQPTLTVTPTITLGTGDVQITLTWNSTNDLDLWVIDPDGEAIYFGKPTSPSGGQLDVDANAGCNHPTRTPVENIFWPPGEAPLGKFRVETQYYQQCESPAPIAYHVRVLVDGKVTEFDKLIQTVTERQTVFEFQR